jgi:carbonic anhydrase/acetyltransferase-like protein (isoleucine patch superfamily)
VVIGPFATVLAGAHIRSAATIDPLAIVHRNASVGAHVKVCSGCEIPENGVVDDWTVIWGGSGGFCGAGGSFAQRRRKRAPRSRTVTGDGNGPDEIYRGSGLLDPRMVEDARLIVLQKERESLAKMIGFPSSPASQKKRWFFFLPP